MTLQIVGGSGKMRMIKYLDFIPVSLNGLYPLLSRM
jgi:hypothetical protein